MDALRDRLTKRGTETPHTLEERVSKAYFELSFAPQFDQILVNDNIDEAAAELVTIVKAFIGVDETEEAAKITSGNEEVAGS